MSFANKEKLIGAKKRLCCSNKLRTAEKFAAATKYAVDATHSKFVRDTLSG